MTSLNLSPAPLQQLTTLSTPSFQLFDLSLATNFTFKTRFPPTSTPADLIFTCQPHPPVSIDLEVIEPLFNSREKTEEGVNQFAFYSNDETIILHFAAIADFYLWTDRIICHPLSSDNAFMIEICFLGIVLACWFELQGIVALHASATVINGRAVAFLSSNKGGKTSLAAALMQQGYPLLTDDILLVDLQDGRAVGRSGYPQMRMWPEQAALFFGEGQDFPVVHPNLDKRRIPIDFETSGFFQSGRFPLHHCYIPERYEPENSYSITIDPVSPIEAVLTLAGYSFLYWLVDAMGLQAKRLQTFTQIIQSVGISRLIYPSGVEHLPAVCQAVVANQ